MGQALHTARILLGVTALLAGCGDNPRIESIHFDEGVHLEGLYGALGDYSVGGVNGRLEFAISDVQTGWVAEIEDVPFQDLVSPRRGDVLTVERTERRISGCTAIVYEAAWTTGNEAERATPLAQVLDQHGGTAIRFASFRVNARLGGGEVSYWALALYGGNENVVVFDDVLGGDVIASIQAETGDSAVGVLDRLEMNERNMRQRYANVGLKILEFETSSVAAVAHLPMRLLVTETDDEQWYGATIGEIIAASPHLADVTRVGLFIVLYDDDKESVHRAVVFYRDRLNPIDPGYSEIIDLTSSI